MQTYYNMAICKNLSRKLKMSQKDLKIYFNIDCAELTSENI